MLLHDRQWTPTNEEYLTVIERDRVGGWEGGRKERRDEGREGGGQSGWRVTVPINAPANEDWWAMRKGMREMWGTAVGNPY